MTEDLNFSQKIAQLLDDKWGLIDELARENIYFAGFQMEPTSRFTKTNKNIVIEVYEVTGTGSSSSQESTKVDDLLRIDIWINVMDGNLDARIKAQDLRAKIRKRIMDIVHQNQKEVTGIKIALMTRFATLDEVSAMPIVLHSVIYAQAEWFHYLSA